MVNGSSPNQKENKQNRCERACLNIEGDGAKGSECNKTGKPIKRKLVEK